MRILTIAVTATSTLSATALAFTLSSSLHSTATTNFAPYDSSNPTKRYNRFNLPLHMATDENIAGEASEHETVDEYRTGLKQIGNRAAKPTVSCIDITLHFYNQKRNHKTYVSIVTRSV